MPAWSPSGIHSKVFQCSTSLGVNSATFLTTKISPMGHNTHIIALASSKMEVISRNQKKELKLPQFLGNMCTYDSHIFIYTHIHTYIYIFFVCLPTNHATPLRIPPFLPGTCRGWELRVSDEGLEVLRSSGSVRLPEGWWESQDLEIKSKIKRLRNTGEGRKASILSTRLMFFSLSFACL